MEARLKILNFWGLTVKHLPRQRPDLPVARGSYTDTVGILFVRGFVLSLSLLLFAPCAISGSRIIGTASVIDGDTLEVQGQRIRLHGIDAPESRQLCLLDDKPWQCGKDAANALAEQIGHRPVTCEDYFHIFQRTTSRVRRLAETCIRYR